MADVFIARTTDFDGSASPITAVGAIIITLSGTVGARGRAPRLTMYSRSGLVAYTPTYSRSKFGRVKLNLAAGDQYYFIVSGIDSDASIDLGVADA